MLGLKFVNNVIILVLPVIVKDLIHVIHVLQLIQHLEYFIIKHVIVNLDIMMMDHQSIVRNVRLNV